MCGCNWVRTFQSIRCQILFFYRSLSLPWHLHGKQTSSTKCRKIWIPVRFVPLISIPCNFAPLNFCALFSDAVDVLLGTFKYKWNGIGFRNVHVCSRYLGVVIDQCHLSAGETSYFIFHWKSFICLWYMNHRHGRKECS